MFLHLITFFTIIDVISHMEKFDSQRAAEIVGSILQRVARITRADIKRGEELSGFILR